MSAKVVRDLFRQWAGEIPAPPFYDTINREQDPNDPIWWTMDFIAEENTAETFCAPGYIERGAVDCVFFATPGGGDGPILAAMEPVIRELITKTDPAHNLVITGYDPVEELTGGTADRFYRLVVGVNYSYHVT